MTPDRPASRPLTQPHTFVAPPPKDRPALRETSVPTGARPDGARPEGMAEVPAPESRMLPPHQTKLDRVTGHLAALSVDLRVWTELRVDLVKRQIEGVQAQIERFEHYADAAKFLVPAVVFALTAVCFLLVTLALGIGALIGSVWGGFAILTALLLVAAALFARVGLKRVRMAQLRAVEAREKDQGKAQRDLEALRESQASNVRQAAV